MSSPLPTPVLGSLALMQPYIFPYVGYFALIAASERFYTFDRAQYIRRGWVHRNRLRHPAAGWRYFSLPVRKAPRSTPCDGVQLRDEPGWRASLLTLLEPYREAPHFALGRELFAEGIAPRNTDIAALCRHALRQTCALLRIDTPIHSDRELELGGARRPPRRLGMAGLPCRRRHDLPQPPRRSRALPARGLRRPGPAAGLCGARPAPL